MSFFFSSKLVFSFFLLRRSELAENFANQMKMVQKNRKADKTDKKGKDFSLGQAQIEAVWTQIAFEYPFMEQVSDSAIMTSHNLKDEPIVFCNDDFTVLTGYPKEEILGRNCRFLQGPHTNPNHVTSIREAIRDGKKVELELLNYRKDGVPFLNGFCMLPLHQPGKREGKVEYFLAIQKNVTVLVNPWRAPINKWSVPEVLMWLDKNKGSGYVKGFMQKEISGKVLETITMDLLQQCGVVLQAEQNRILRLLDNEKALRLARGEQYQTLEMVGGDYSVDDSTSMQSVSVATSHRNTPTAGNSEHNPRSVIQVDDEDESLSDAGAYQNSTRTPSTASSANSKKGTGRKMVITATFRGNCRQPVKIIVSSASTSHMELRRVIRKKTGRKYELHNMHAPDGLTSKMTMELEPTFEGLDSNYFGILDGLPDPVLVTDNVGLIVFANDNAWNTLMFEDDPVDTFVMTYFKSNSNDPLNSLRDVRNNRMQATFEDDSQWNVTFNPVTVGKNKLFVWSFQRN
jgi:PAS domain S-box-containing protein